MLNFIDGLLIGILATLIVHKIYIEIKYKAYKNIIGEKLDEVLKELPDELPIEREEDNE